MRAYIFVTAILLSALTIPSRNTRAQAAGQINKPAAEVVKPLKPLTATRDSLVVISPNGDTTVTYLPQRYDFGEMPMRKIAPKELRASKESIAELTGNEPLKKRAMAIQNARVTNHVGQIPYEEGISQSGARTYIVPVATGSSLPQTPSVSLQYSSQSGNGVAGYGWSIGGLSSITLTNKSIYYHGTCDAASNSDSVYALDGMPLVQNTSIMSDTYPLITARGNILARIVSTSGYARQFEVLYPDGTRAEYGVSLFSSTAVLSFPVTRIEDVHGNYMTFSYTEWNGIYHITDIWYGGSQSRSPMAQIHFGYDDRSDYVNRYFLGKEHSERKILKSIVSSDNGAELRTYTLSHSLTDEACLLTSISCSIGGEQLNPLTFGYNNAEYAASNFEVKDSIIVSNAFNQSECDFVYRRGKLVPDSDGDGIIIYPSFSTYAPLEKKWVPFDNRYRYGSAYDPNQSILIFPYNRSFFSQARTILAGDGFQTVEAVDVDGDGVDEIVKVNHNGTGSNRTNLLITVYEYDTTTRDFTFRSFNAYITGNVSNPQFTSPSQLACYFGDYVGDGRTKLMVYSYDQNAYGKSQTSEGTLIDLESGAVLKRQSLFSLSLEDAKNVISLDIDSDSRTEFCHLTSSGLGTYSYRGTGSGFVLDGTYNGITSNDIPSNADDTFFTDINADGYIDIVSKTASSNTWTVRSFNGNQFSSSTFNVLNCTGDKFMFMDVNRDGLPDLVVARQNFLHVYLNENGSISSVPCCSYPISDTKGIVPCNIANYNGMSNFIKVDGFYVYCYSFMRNLQERRLITSFWDSFDRHTENVYKEMSSCALALGYTTPEVYDIDESLPANGSGFARVTMPVYLLYNEIMSMTELGSEHVIKSNYYRYFNATASTQGLGFCGFRQIRATDTRGGSSQWRISNTYYDPEKFGCVIRQEQGLRSQSPVTVTELTYDSNFTTYGKLNPRLVGTTETDALTGVTSTASYTYGSYDLPTTIQTSHRIGAGTAQTETTSRTYQNSTSTSRYVLGAVSAESVTRESDGSSATSWQSRTVMTYDGNFRPLTKMSYVGTTGTNPVSEQLWQYDSHGNVTIERTARYGATAFNETSYTYDSSGRLLTSSTDALGRTTTYSGHDLYGNPSQETDWLGRITAYVYDAWGDLTQTTLPDGTVQTSAASWSTGGEPGLICITKAATGCPDTKVWSDALGREVRSAGRRFDGSWQYKDSEYDSHGRLARTSLPYKGSGPSLWNTCTYDEYDRPIRRDEACGRTTTWAYSGTSTTTTSEGISSTSTTDASGNVVSVTDPGGTIAYALRDDAQPSSVTVTPAGSSQGVVTTFSYDVHGRRTSMVDPSAGSRTTSYTDNADGTSSVASTGPNGTVTTSYDRYGRVTAVARPEFSTSYTYGTSLSSSSYGMLLGESSTNGTARAFTYDDLGRILTETEYADNAHWLRKIYTYGAGSSVASVSYATQDGEITTESFEYANGHGTAVTIPGSSGTTVWRLTAENALGQPTAMTTGTARRSYAFTATGIPQARIARSSANAVMQDLSYSYDAISGNMLWRQDNAAGYRETFTYDGHNRLLSSMQVFTGDIRADLDYSHVNMDYSSNGNVTRRDNDGILDLSLEYTDAADPYRATGNHPYADGMAYAPEYGHVSMTSFDRPAGIGFPGSNASTVFTYNAAGDRTRMTRDEDQYGIHMDRYYLGGVYERDLWRDGNGPDAERLFLGGNAYDAPMVLVKAQAVNGGAWTPFNILRDVQGSITEVTSADGGTVVESFRYDPWGLRIIMGDVASSDTLVVDIPDFPGEGDVAVADSTIALPGWQMAGQSLYVGGHGYTGHEHLPGWGLINMNARLYDPALCRFLSPDPVLQDPANTQNFNRYTYCLNNPLKFTDESGEVVISALLISIGVGAIVNVAFNWSAIDNVWEGLSVAALGAGAGALSLVTGGSSIGIQMLAGLGVGAVNSAANNAVKQLGNSGNGCFDCKEFWKSSISGAFTGAVTAGANKLINAGKVTNLLDRLNVKNNLTRNVIGNSIEGSFSGLAAGIANGIGQQYVNNGFSTKWDWGQVGMSSLLGVAIGGAMGATNGAITEGIYQKQLEKGYDPKLLNSDVAEALGERAGDIAANLEASSMGSIWPWGHDYANRFVELIGSICIGIQTGRCTINIDPRSPMIPSVSTYYAPKL